MIGSTAKLKTRLAVPAVRLFFVSIALVMAGHVTALAQTPLFKGVLEPDSVMVVLEHATLERLREDFFKVVADSFVYVVDDVARLDAPEVDWDNWNLEQEKVFQANILSDLRQAEIALLPYVKERGMPRDGRAVYLVSYILIVEDEVFRGEAELTFVCDAADYWYLWRWREVRPVFADPTSELWPTAGVARARYAR